VAGARRSRAAAFIRVVALVVPALLVLGGIGAVAFVLSSQEHAPQPTAIQAGSLGPRGTSAFARGRSNDNAGAAWHSAASSRATVRSILARSRPVLLSIPAIGVSTRLLVVGRNPNGSIQVPPLFARPSEAAWYRYSPTPGQLGPSIIVGHVDNIDGPAVFFRLGALRPGERIEVSLADGALGVFRVDGVRRYAKSAFPTQAVYGPLSYPALRLITCGGPFDGATRQYLDNIVVYASLVAAHPAPAAKGAT
jgi:hypothetical protein